MSTCSAPISMADTAGFAGVVWLSPRAAKSCWIVEYARLYV